MRILVDIRKLSDRPDGIGYYGFNIINHIINRFPNAHIIGVTDVKKGKLIEQLEKKIDIIVYNKKVDRTIEIFKYYKFLYDNIVRNKPDVFLELNFFIPFKVDGVKNISVIHDIIPLQFPEYFTLSYNMYFRIMIYITNYKLDSAIFNSNYTKNNYTHKFHSPIPNVVLYPIFEVEPPVINQCNEEKYLLYLGFSCKRKGIDILLKSFSKIVNKTNLNLIVVGGSDTFGEKLLTKYKGILEDRLEVKNYVSEDDKRKLLSKCYALILPSRAEGFGIPIYEALLYKKRVLASNLEVFKEVYENNISYFELGNNSINNLADAILLLEREATISYEYKMDYSQNIDELLQ